MHDAKLTEAISQLTCVLRELLEWRKCYLVTRKDLNEAEGRILRSLKLKAGEEADLGKMTGDLEKSADGLREAVASAGTDGT